MRRHARTYVFAAPLALLVACGGGSRPATPAASPNVAITATNAEAVAGAAYETAYMPARLARIVLGFVEVAPPTPPTGGNPAIVTQTVAGPDGGSAVVTWNDVDRDGLYTSGDAFTVAFDAYSAHGLILAGTATLDGTYIDGNPLTSLTWICAASLELLGVTYDGGAGPRTAAGTFTVRRERRAITEILSLVATGEATVGLRTLGSGSGSGRNEYTLDFQQGFYGDGRYVDPVAGGAFDYATVRTMTGLQFLPDPGFGEFLVSGANGTSVTIVPVDLFSIDLLVDENGDGEVDATIATDWATLWQ